MDEAQSLGSDALRFGREEDVADVALLVLGVRASGDGDDIVLAAEDLLQLVDGDVGVEVGHPDDTVLGRAGLDGE